MLFHINCIQAQSWPSTTWSAAKNLTNVMDVNGVQDLSGLHFNPIYNRLYCVQGNGVLRVLQFNSVSNTFTQIANKNINGGPEGITQANLYANEFYTIDENNYEIRRFTHTSNFSTVTLYKHWNLLISPSTMTDTGNTGPEGIVFIPDSFLSTIGFKSQQTGKLYTSVKGLGGLFFIASQDAGYIWVYDLNPNANDDFDFVGKYKTNQSESCDLTFDRSTGLLYILHNISGNNKLEVTDLTTKITNGGNYKFEITNEYDVPSPNDSNDNIEGFAMMSKCSDSGNLNAWLCRDVENNESLTIQQDALRMFSPFVSDGICIPLSNSDFKLLNQLKVYPNPSKNNITISSEKIQNATIKIFSNVGQLLIKKDNLISNSIYLDISDFQTGVYFIEVHLNEFITRTKFLKI